MYYFDSYALFEILEGNPAYDEYSDIPTITSMLNIGELYYGLLKRISETRAEVLVNHLEPDLLDLDVDIVMRAMEFRHQHIKKKFSMIDCIGYQLALSHNLKFLTGDKEFEGLPGVEFVSRNSA